MKEFLDITVPILNRLGHSTVDPKKDVKDK